MTRYLISPSLADEANDGWIWSNEGLPTRSVIKVVNPRTGRSVYCLSRQIDKNFLRKYNDGRRKPVYIDDKCVLIMSEWYRDALGIGSSGQYVELDVVQSRVPLWGSIRAACQTPDLVARIGTRLGVLGAWLGIVGLAPVLCDLLKTAWPHLINEEVKLAGCLIVSIVTAIAGFRACIGVSPVTKEQPNSTADWNEENIGIYAYGSLLVNPGRDIAPHIVARVPCVSPWPIEYARKSKRSVPTLVKHPGGGHVMGAILVLDVKAGDLDLVRQWLLRREGASDQTYVGSMKLGGLTNVLYADLPINIPDTQLNPDYLADLAIDSVNAMPVGERNGIRYLVNNVNHEIITPMTGAYVAAILKKIGAGNLEQAEEIATRRTRS